MVGTLNELDELTYDYEGEDGTLIRKQLDRVVLSEGAWPTVMFLYQELDPKSGRYRAPRMTLVRLKKSRGGYRKHSSFNITGAAQARQIAEVFERWSPKIAEAAAEAAAEAVEAAGGDTDSEDSERADEDAIGDDA